MDNKPCLHCGGTTSDRRRFCYKCGRTPGVRDLYPSDSKFARVGSGVTGSSAEPEPTDAAPRSDEYFAVLAERARRGLALSSKRDAVLDLG